MAFRRLQLYQKRKKTKKKTFLYGAFSLSEMLLAKFKAIHRHIDDHKQPKYNS